MNLWKFMDFQKFKKIKKWKKIMNKLNKKFLNLKKHRLKLIKREKNNF